MSWGDQLLPGLENVPTDETKRKRLPSPTKEGTARWARFKPNSFMCFECLRIRAAAGTGAIKYGNLRREDHEGQTFWCFQHGEDKKLEDKKAGLWDSK